MNLIPFPRVRLSQYAVSNHVLFITLLAPLLNAQLRAVLRS